MFPSPTKNEELKTNTRFPPPRRVCLCIAPPVNASESPWPFSVAHLYPRPQNRDRAIDPPATLPTERSRPTGLPAAAQGDLTHARRDDVRPPRFTPLRSGAWRGSDRLSSLHKINRAHFRCQPHRLLH